MFNPKIISLAETLVSKASAKNIKITCAESCTGGLLAAAITEISGSSAIFDGSFVTYSNTQKQNLLSVSNATLDSFGAVSTQTAQEMAIGANAKTNAHISISITGIAGPTGGTAQKPIGTVYFGVSSRNQTTTHHQIFSGSRTQIRIQAVAFALTKLIEQVEAF